MAIPVMPRLLKAFTEFRPKTAAAKSGHSLIHPCQVFPYVGIGICDYATRKRAGSVSRYH